MNTRQPFGRDPRFSRKSRGASWPGALARRRLARRTRPRGLGRGPRARGRRPEHEEARLLADLEVDRLTVTRDAREDHAPPSALTGRVCQRLDDPDVQLRSRQASDLDRRSVAGREARMVHQPCHHATGSLLPTTPVPSSRGDDAVPHLQVEQVLPEGQRRASPVRQPLHPRRRRGSRAGRRRTRPLPVYVPGSRSPWRRATSGAPSDPVHGRRRRRCLRQSGPGRRLSRPRHAMPTASVSALPRRLASRDPRSGSAPDHLEVGQVRWIPGGPVQQFSRVQASCATSKSTPIRSRRPRGHGR